MYLTPMKWSRNLLERTQDRFGGVDRSGGAGDGSIFDMKNMSADRWPLLTTRHPRYWAEPVANPNGMYIRPGVRAWVSGTTLWVNGAEAGQVTPCRKIMVGLGDRIVIWPDKVCYDVSDGKLTALEAEWTGEAAFSDGTYAGEPALANTMTVAADLTGMFRVGDAVTVETDGGKRPAQIIREIEWDEAAGKCALRFYEETWREFVEQQEDGTDGAGQRLNVTVRREVPDLELVFEHNNRLWGAKGSTIRVCKLGDPTNWQVYDGLSTDSYELELGTPGVITGGCSYGGRPVFFKEHAIAKIYGDSPASWQLSQTESLGVEAGSSNSLAVAGDVLFYKSAAGIMAYSGGYPRCVSGELGEARYRNATAGSDGVRYYVSMERIDGDWEVWCYDTRHGTWHPEDGLDLFGFGRDSSLQAMDSRGMIITLGEALAPPEGARREEGLSSWVEFNDWTDGTMRKKGAGKLLVRLEADKGTDLTLMIQYDSTGVWYPIRTIKGGMVKGQVEIQIPLRRCDHYRLRINGTGMARSGWTLHALTWRRYAGSNRT